MNAPDTRWIQRLESFTRALEEVRDAVDTRGERPLSRLEAMGLIQAFEFTYELGWKLLKDYLEYQGVADLVGSRDTVREAVTRGLLSESEGSVWMTMLQDRNRTSHLYDEETVRAIESSIVRQYLHAFMALETDMTERARHNG